MLLGTWVKSTQIILQAQVETNTLSKDGKGKGNICKIVMYYQTMWYCELLDAAGGTSGVLCTAGSYKSKPSG